MKKQKGEIGYIKSQRLIKLIHTIIMFALSLSMYFFGIAQIGTNQSLYTVFAILGMLPASKSLVITIMYYRANECNIEIYNKITSTDSRFVLYSLYLTMYKKSCSIDCMNFYNNCIIAYASGKIDTNLTEEHIKNILNTNNYNDITVKIFTNFDSYYTRIEQLNGKNDFSEAKETKTETKIKNIMQLIKRISL